MSQKADALVAHTIGIDTGKNTLHLIGLDAEGAIVLREKEKITRDVMEVLDYGEESVSVAMEEISSSNWSKQVYQPDIKAKWNTLYKKPGYEM